MSSLADTLSHTLQQLAAAAKHPDPDLARLTAASEALAAVTPRMNALTAEERKQLEPQLASILANLENAIAQLTTAKEETATQLRALRNRTAALNAYGKK